MNKISIVVPIYNMGNKISDCVKSLMQQTYKNIEIILVDDGSKDDSFEKCKELERLDQRIKVFHTENQGSGPARNFGIEKASGRYIYFPDADDYLELNAVEKLELAMREKSCDLVVFGYRNVFANGKILSTKIYPDMEKYGMNIRADYSDYMTTESKYGIQGAPWNKFFDLDIIKKYDIKYPQLRRHQDEGFIARYMCYVNKVVFIGDVLYIYYVNDLSKEWDKYPIDYIESVKGLYNDRKNNILIWNKNDLQTHALVKISYICGIIKSLELSFSPKYKFNRSQRIEWMKCVIKNTEIYNFKLPQNIGLYQKIIYFIIKYQQYNILYLLLKFKVFVEKSGYLDKLRR